MDSYAFYRLGELTIYDRSDGNNFSELVARERNYCCRKIKFFRIQNIGDARTLTKFEKDEARKWQNVETGEQKRES